MKNSWPILGAILLTVASLLVPQTDAWAAPHAVKVTSATYGVLGSGNVCDAAAPVTASCSGQTTCEVAASNGLCGDPAPGTVKKLEIKYTCGQNPNINTLVLDEHAAAGQLFCSCRSTLNNEFGFSCNGQLEGMTCVQLREDADPDTWQDNYFCSKTDIGMRWSSSGPIDGMRCTQDTLETSDPHTWNDNYMCLPKDSSWRLRWSSAGPIAGGNCVHWLEPADPHTWEDNFMCYRKEGYTVQQGSCRGDGWNGNGWPRAQGFKTPDQCKAACDNTPGCTSFDLSQRQGKTFECFIFGHANPVGDGGSDSCYIK